MTAPFPSRRRHAARRIIVALLLAIGLRTPSPAPAQDRPHPTEYQLKAEYLTDFGRFVKKWGNRPMPGPDESFDICVLGQDPFGQSLDTAVRGDNIAGAPLVVRRIGRAADAAGCRILYIADSESGELPGILAALGASPVLTVADIPDFVRHGGMIEFVLDGNRVKFEINLAVTQRAGLNLSSELLKVARLVRRTP
ncbi:MAG TPA: YfiR family protein [Bryobacteraceae bacterium]|nr:YfiR family protein [Bryobacteraceae bacterium]